MPPFESLAATDRTPAALLAHFEKADAEFRRILSDVRNAPGAALPLSTCAASHSRHSPSGVFADVVAIGFQAIVLNGLPVRIRLDPIVRWISGGGAIIRVPGPVSSRAGMVACRRAVKFSV